MNLMHIFPLITFDNCKCTTLEVKLHTEQGLCTGHNRKHSHLLEMWNVQRPYIRWLCKPIATSECKGSLYGLTMQYGLWLMNWKYFFLTILFPLQDLLLSLYSCMIWMYDTTRVASKATIVFHIGREQIIKVAIQLSWYPNQHYKKLTF